MLVDIVGCMVGMVDIIGIEVVVSIDIIVDMEGIMGMEGIMVVVSGQDEVEEGASAGGVMPAGGIVGDGYSAAEDGAGGAASGGLAGAPMSMGGAGTALAGFMSPEGFMSPAGFMSPPPPDEKAAIPLSRES